MVKKFEYNNNEDTNYQSSGFIFHIPESALRTDVTKTDVSVKIVSDPTYFHPANTRLVSEVYIISALHPLMKPVTVKKIEYSKSIGDADNLCFIRCQNHNPPYYFENVEGRNFQVQNICGNIDLNEFSGFGVFSHFKQVTKIIFSH